MNSKRPPDKAAWLTEFYQMSATECAIVNEYAPQPDKDIALLDHSIAKWTGLLKANLNRYGFDADTILSDYATHRTDLPITVGSESCALCLVYTGISATAPHDEHACTGCPLYESRGKIPCDSVTREETQDTDYPLSPWHAWTRRSGGSALPMLRALKKAKRWRQKSKSK